MKWTFPLGRLAGIAVNAHATFLILLVWIAVASWMEFRSLLAVVAGVAFVLALFGCVVAHELPMR
jgi:Zn-dependent protease